MTPKQGIIVGKDKVRVVGNPFAPPPGQTTHDVVRNLNAAEDKRRRRAAKRLEKVNGKDKA